MMIINTCHSRWRTGSFPSSSFLSSKEHFVKKNNQETASRDMSRDISKSLQVFDKKAYIKNTCRQRSGPTQSFATFHGGLAVGNLDLQSHGDSQTVRRSPRRYSTRVAIFCDFPWGWGWFFGWFTILILMVIYSISHILGHFGELVFLFSK